LWHKRFFVVKYDGTDILEEWCDNFEYKENDINMPFEGRLRQNEVHIVRAAIDKEGNYALTSTRPFFVENLNRRIDNREIKKILDEVTDMNYAINL
jgi:hypothetical protein